MVDNNNFTAITNMTQPTMMDLFNLVSKCATKEDIDEFATNFNRHISETNEKIQHIQLEVEEIAGQSNYNTDKIEFLEASIEQLKQDQLRNNLCISGVPPNMLNGNETSGIIIQIAKKLNVEITGNQFSSYAVANNKFIIVRFFNIKHKQQMQNKIRAKRSLMVEECFTVKSNGQIYLNDHLTPYLNNLFLMARSAKKDGKLASATSHGGKIRVRKSANDAPVIVTYEGQLRTIVEMSSSTNTSQSFQHGDDSIISNASASKQVNSGKGNNDKRKATNTSKRCKVNKNQPNTSSKGNSTNTQPGTRKRRSDDSEQRNPERVKRRTSQ